MPIIVVSIDSRLLLILQPLEHGIDAELSPCAAESPSGARNWNRFHCIANDSPKQGYNHRFEKWTIAGTTKMAEEPGKALEFHLDVDERDELKFGGSARAWPIG